LQALFQSAQHLFEKREGSGPGSVPLTNRNGSGRPKNMRSRISNTVFLMLHTSVHKKIFSVQDKHPSCSSSPFGQSRGRGLAVVEEGGGGGDATPTSEGEAASLPHPHHHHHLHPSGAVSLSAAIQRISSQHNVSITV
jgi:hypothetical protein